MSSGITDSSLLYHLENAKAHGVTKAEAAAIITHAPFFCAQKDEHEGQHSNRHHTIPNQRSQRPKDRHCGKI